jgi:uncharacterized nucleotidyltransferase DUF6036
MRRAVDAARVYELMRALGAAADAPGRVYFTGGATAVLEGWRESTVDVDLKIVPDTDALFRALPRLKEELEINLELVVPSDFIPELPGWEGRCRFITREGGLSFYHYDPYGQALAKIERGHERDLADVRAMMEGGLVERDRLWTLFESIEPQLYRFPAIDPKSFRVAVERAVG